METLNFIERAKLWGHDVGALANGKEIKTTVKVRDLNALKLLVQDKKPAAERIARGNAIYEKYTGLSDVENAHTETDLLRRVSAFLYGDHSLADLDVQRAQGAFPLEVTQVSIPVKTLAPGEAWNLAQNITGPIAQYNVGTLNMGAGSYIYINNLPLVFSVDIINKSEGTVKYDFAVLGATGLAGIIGPVVTNTASAGDGTVGTCQSAGISGSGGGKGDTGPGGNVGNAGGTGLSGLPSWDATISIAQAVNITGDDQNFYIFTQSGAGGAGGTGGTGAPGNTGGVGGAGANCDCEGSAGGNGGAGGQGGTGGTGGQGGDGVDGSDVQVYAVAKDAGKIIKLYGLNEYGPGGTGGQGGAGGAGGTGGAAGKDNSAGNAGGTGGAGNSGQPGSPGTKKGDPGTIFVNPV